MGPVLLGGRRHAEWGSHLKLCGRWAHCMPLKAGPEWCPSQDAISSSLKHNYCLDFYLLNFISFLFLPLPIREELIEKKTQSAVSGMQSVDWAWANDLRLQKYSSKNLMFYLDVSKHRSKSLCLWNALLTHKTSSNGIFFLSVVRLWMTRY
jgi:hypothetical protein